MKLVAKAIKTQEKRKRGRVRDYLVGLRASNSPSHPCDANTYAKCTTLYACERKRRMKMQLPKRMKMQLLKQQTRAPPYWSRSLSAMKEKEWRKEERDS